MSVPTVAPDVGAPTTTTRRARRRALAQRAPGAGRGWVFPTLFMLAFLVYFLMPLFWLVVASTKSLDALFDSFGLWFSHFNLFDNIKDTFKQDNGVYWDWLRNTLMYSVVSAVGAALLAAAAGYGFAKFAFRGKNFLFWVVLGSVMVPTTALAIPTYLMFSKLGFTNNPLSIILPSLVSPFGIYLMRIYAEAAVPTDLIEAARIDGANEFLIFRRIAFRLLAPGFVTVLLFTFVATWNNYFLPLVMLSEPKWYPLTVGLQQWNSQATAGGGATSAFNIVITGSLISIIPLILAFTFLQRYWQSGLGSGGVKG
jgi:multiple sugar transport system permease protein